MRKFNPDHLEQSSDIKIGMQPINIDDSLSTVNQLVLQGEELDWDSMKESAMPFIAAGWSFPQIAETLGVKPESIKKWMKDPDYQKAISQLRAKHVELLWRGVTSLSTKILNNIWDALNSEDEKIKWDSTRWAAQTLGVADQMRGARNNLEIRIEGSVDSETLRDYLLPALKQELDIVEGQVTYSYEENYRDAE